MSRLLNNSSAALAIQVPSHLCTQCRRAAFLTIRPSEFFDLAPPPPHHPPSTMQQPWINPLPSPPRRRPKWTPQARKPDIPPSRRPRHRHMRLQLPRRRPHKTIPQHTLLGLRSRPSLHLARGVHLAALAEEQPKLVGRGKVAWDGSGLLDALRGARLKELLVDVEEVVPREAHKNADVLEGPGD